MPHRTNPTMTMGFLTSSPLAIPVTNPLPSAVSVGRGSSSVMDVSKITSKGQLTLPKTVRTALGVAEGDSVRFVMQDDQIVVEAASDGTLEDPAVAAFLDILENSINEASDFPIEMMEAMRTLTKSIEVHLDAPIDGDVVI